MRLRVNHASGDQAAPSCYDLFSGAGGLTLGLVSAGFRSVGAIENDDVAASSCEANFGRHPASFLGSAAGDIRKLAPATITRRITASGVTELDLLAASPPCQGFSRVGRGKLDSLAFSRGAFAKDQRNGLYASAIEILEELRPRFFLLENVVGILHLRGRNVAEDVCDALSEAGYVARCAILNAAWYGVPQVRERVVIIAARRDLNIEPRFPGITHSVRLTRGHLSQARLSSGTWRHPGYFVQAGNIHRIPDLQPAITVSEALEDLPPFTAHLEALHNGRRYRSRRECFSPVEYRHPPRNAFSRRMREWDPSMASEAVTDHYCRWTPRDFATFARMKPGDRYPQAVAIARQRFEEELERSKRPGSDLPNIDDFVPPYTLDTFPEKWRKLIPDYPSWTITAHLSHDGYSHIHHSDQEARTITPREAARLQSFPDAFVFRGNTGEVYRQIGNAVPPLLAGAVGRSILDQMNQMPASGKPRHHEEAEWSSIQQPLT